MTKFGWLSLVAFLALIGMAILVADVLRHVDAQRCLDSPVRAELCSLKD